MRSNQWKLASVFVIALATFAWMSADASGGFAINWYTFDGGGGASSGGNFALNGTIAQPDAHPETAGGNFALQSGFWTVTQLVPTAVALTRIEHSAEILPQLLWLITILLSTISLYLFWRHNTETTQ